MEGSGIMAFVTIYRNDNYDDAGRNGLELSYSSGGLPDPYNDTMTSFQVAEGRSAIFYQHAHYGGWSFKVPGDYPNNCPGVRAEHNDEVSSIAVFSDPDFANQV
jgi:hypothetical protein